MYATFKSPDLWNSLAAQNGDSVIKMADEMDLKNNEGEVLFSIAG